MKGWVLITLLVLIGALSVAGLWSAMTDLRHAKKFGELFVSWSALIYGTSGVPAVLGILFKRKWGLPFLWIWGAGCVIASTFAPIFYGEAPVYAGVISGVSCVLLLSPIIYFGSRAILK
jgi:hypothetical protein